MSGLFPSFSSSDRELDLTYNYRCELFNKHIRSVPSGHVVTEFLKDVPWAGIYNTINCAAFHHFKEGRWMKDPSVMYEYADFWCTEGNPRLYSFPLSDSILELCKVTGDFLFAEKNIEKLLEINRAWDDHKKENGLYFQFCDRDGMEYSISGNGFRPTINSYIYADKKALSYFASETGDGALSEKLRVEAETLRNLINTDLWNDKIGIYSVLSEDGILQNVRELIGYIPWIYGIPSEERDGAFRYLFDSECFKAPYGLRTADFSHPDYRKPFGHECLWNGPVWPFATSQTLTALINYLHTDKDHVVTDSLFMDLLLTYAYSQRDVDGSPYIDENMDPETGVWLAREIMRSWNRPDKDPTRGAHYNHSTFVDLVITGVCGICPSADDKLTVAPLGRSLEFFYLEGVKYHGCDVTVRWDRSDGLCVTVDGRTKYKKNDGSDIKIHINL